MIDLSNIRANFDDLINQAKNDIGRQVFDTATGQIKSGLESRGVDLQVAVPSPKQGDEDKKPITNYLPFIGIGLIGLVIYLKSKKSGRA